MFTGLVQVLGTVVSCAPSAAGGGDLQRLLVRAPEFWGALGASVAVNGCCLTLVEAVKPDAQGFSQLAFDVGAETLRVTSLGSLHPGGAVNLESALTLATPLGGHLVSGHVDEVGRIAAVEDRADGCRFVAVELRPAEPAWLIPKGSICCHGVSLTLNRLIDKPKETRVEFLLIPTTLEKTNLGQLCVGDPVNIEYDLVGKYAVRHNSLSRSGT
ncbi:MAG: riboflavin synthase [Zetaproteobacteria bacterium]|nr:riboflavin synthase [Zetaproteobacteria bacterium]